jgi:hypothetical protein
MLSLGTKIEVTYGSDGTDKPSAILKLENQISTALGDNEISELISSVDKHFKGHSYE